MRKVPDHNALCRTIHAIMRIEPSERLLGLVARLQCRCQGHGHRLGLGLGLVRATASVMIIRRGSLVSIINLGRARLETCDHSLGLGKRSRFRPVPALNPSFRRRRTVFPISTYCPRRLFARRSTAVAFRNARSTMSGRLRITPACLRIKALPKCPQQM